MTAIQAILLGILQGATEFLPISSSGHLALMHWATGWSVSPAADLSFDVALHAGTLTAIVAYFARDWIAFFRRRDRMVAFVLVASVPGALAGVVLEDAAATIFRGPVRVAIMLALLGLLMAAAERWGKHTMQIEKMGWAHALAVGCGQALAIMPGVSRAGITMTVGLALGFTREASARFSFLLATPILLGATLWEGVKLLSGEGAPIGAGPLVAGMLAAAITGLACVHFLLQFLRRHTFYPFVIYRLALAAAVLVAVALGAETG